LDWCFFCLFFFWLSFLIKWSILIVTCAFFPWELSICREPCMSLWTLDRHYNRRQCKYRTIGRILILFCRYGENSLYLARQIRHLVENRQNSDATTGWRPWYTATGGIEQHIRRMVFSRVSVAKPLVTGPMTAEKLFHLQNEGFHRPKRTFQ